jgi:predicted transcriptional regulator
MVERMKVREAASAFVQHYLVYSDVPPEDLVGLLEKVFHSMNTLVNDPEKVRPAVPIDQSVTPEYLVCLEDGEHVTLLKRYLQNHHKMTPQQYREKWGLPEDYPFVARSYSEKRSQIAKEQGLGKS